MKIATEKCKHQHQSTGKNSIYNSDKTRWHIWWMFHTSFNQNFWVYFSHLVTDWNTQFTFLTLNPLLLSIIYTLKICIYIYYTESILNFSVHAAFNKWMFYKSTSLLSMLPCSSIPLWIWTHTHNANPITPYPPLPYLYNRLL